MYCEGKASSHILSCFLILINSFPSDNAQAALKIHSNALHLLHLMERLPSHIVWKMDRGESLTIAIR